MIILATPGPSRSPIACSKAETTPSRVKHVPRASKHTLISMWGSLMIWFEMLDATGVMVVIY